MVILGLFLFTFNTVLQQINVKSTKCVGIRTYDLESAPITTSPRLPAKTYGSVAAVKQVHSSYLVIGNFYRNNYLQQSWLLIEKTTRKLNKQSANFWTEMLRKIEK